jgi:hypothetical protein
MMISYLSHATMAELVKFVKFLVEDYVLANSVAGLLLKTGGLSVPDYIQQQMDNHNFKPSTVLDLAALDTTDIDIDTRDWAPYQGKTIFEIYLASACESYRGLFDEGKKEFLYIMHLLLARGGAEMAPAMVDSILESSERHTNGEFVDHICDFRVRGAIIDVLAEVCPEYITQSVEWGNVDAMDWVDIPGIPDPNSLHYMMYLKYCSEFLRGIPFVTGGHPHNPHNPHFSVGDTP